MGAVLHTLNIRLFPEQIAFVANEAEDQIVVVDASLTTRLAPVLGDLETVHTVIVVGEGETGPLQASGKTVLSYAELIEAESPEFDWPRIDENSASAMCYTSGTTGNPKGVVYSHRSSFLHTMGACSANGMGVGASDSILPVVSMYHANAWGLPYAALMAGAHHLERRHAPPRGGPGPRPFVAASRRLRWLGRPRVADAHVRGEARRSDPAAVGHDGNLADGDHGLAAAGDPGGPALGISRDAGPTAVRGGDADRG
jgi:fatty-acyl-CoA synthase